MKTKVRVVQDDEQPVEKDILATAIVRISDSLVKLRKSGLNDKAIIALVKDDTNMTKTGIKLVLDSLTQLSRNYCR